MIRHLEAAFDGCPESIALARRVLALALADLPPAVRDDALLCASELVTNAIRYSASGKPGGTVRLVADVADRVRLAVLDEGGPTEPVMLPPSRSGEGGRGLPIIAALGALSVSGDCHGRCVTAMIPLPVTEVAR